MKETIRLRNFLIELDQLIQDNEYYDDELETEVCDITEEQAYDILMRTEEYHFIGADKVKSYIKGFIGDFGFRMSTLRTFKAL